MHAAPTPADLELLEAVLSSWFMVGRLGGYNAMNLQVFPPSVSKYLVTCSLKGQNFHGMAVQRRADVHG